MLLIGACGGDAPPTATPGPLSASPSDAPAPTTPVGSPQTAPAAAATPRVPLVPGSIALAPALGGRAWDRPTELVAYPGGEYLVADQGGLVLRVDADGRDRGTFLDQRGVTYRAGNEEGLLSVALDPDFRSNRYVYVYASRGNPRRTVLFRYTVNQDNAADPASELIILEIAQPFPNHKGGAIRFGPDRLLYLGLGDGGSGGSGADPGNRAQNLQELLGKIIRLDVRGATRDQPYRPAGDPGLISRGARPEIFAYGLRNPWRMAWDTEAGLSLLVGDVGQNGFEEVDRIVGGGNYGWPIIEGEECYRPASNCPRDGLEAPLATYPTSGGNCSITGGEVYRGAAIPALHGYYLYADFCSGRLWALGFDGSVDDKGPIQLLDSSFRIASFARDHNGDILAVAHEAAIQRIVSAR